MRCRHRIRALFTRTVLQINSSLFTTCLSIAEDQPVRADALLFNKVIDHGIYPVPAKLLSRLAGFAIPDDSDLTVGTVAQSFGSAGQQNFCILAQRYGPAPEVDAGQVTDITFAGHSCAIGVDIGFKV